MPYLVQKNKNNNIVKKYIFNQVAKTDFDFAAHKVVRDMSAKNPLPLIFIEKISYRPIKYGLMHYS